MAPDEDDDVLDAWRSCGHAVRVKTLDVVVDGASDSGDDSTTVRVRIGTKDVRRALEVEVDPYFFDAGYSVAASKKYGSTSTCLLYTSPSPRDGLLSRMPSSA